VQSEKSKQNRQMIGSQNYTIPNPIITVTEHTPTPSPDYMRRQVIYFTYSLLLFFKFVDYKIP